MSKHEAINFLQEKAVALRREFHAHPEVSLQEYNTAVRIEQELDDIGIEHSRVGKTGVFGVLKGKKAGVEKIVALRADIDALPIPDKKTTDYKSQNFGVSHACGHDAHTAALLVAARVLKELQEQFSGEIRFFFQQAEEIGGGATQFIEAGYLKNVSQIFGVHVASNLPYGRIAAIPGALAASCDYFKITVLGKSGHASAPDKGVDALYVASQIVVNLQSIASRLTSPVEPVVVAVGTISGGNAYNVIASKIVLEGTTRTFNPEVRKFTNNQVSKIAKQISSLYGASAEVEFKDFASPLINNHKSALLAQRVAAQIVGEDNVIKELPKMLGADDFAEYLTQVPGVYIQVGTRNDANPYTQSAHHTSEFDIDERALELIVKAHVYFALDFLANEA